MPPPRAEVCLSIDAPIELVWSVMLDLPRYAEWNPFVVRVDGITAEPREGQSMLLHVRWNDGSQVTSRELLSRVEPPTATSPRAVLAYAFRGPLHTLGLVRASRLQTIEQTAGPATFYRSEEDFRGLFAFAVPLGKVQDGFERHARALKRRAEALHVSHDAPNLSGDSSKNA